MNTKLKNNHHPQQHKKLNMVKGKIMLSEFLTAG